MNKVLNVDNIHKNKLIYFKEIQNTLEALQAQLKKMTAENHFGTDWNLLNTKIDDVLNKTEEMDYWLSSFPKYYAYKQEVDSENIETETVDLEISFGKEKNSKKSSLLKDYLSSIRDGDFNLDFSDHYNESAMTRCRCGSSKLINEKSFVGCMDCGLEIGMDFTNYKPGFKELQDTTIKPHYYYKRQNHFQECINQIQGRETITIPGEVYDSIYEECRKLRIEPLSLSSEKIKFILKKTKWTKYSENNQYILYAITGRRNISFSIEFEDKLNKMFDEIQAPFDRHKGERKNFLSYNYCFYKFFELMGLDEYLGYFQLLKDRQKLAEHDVIWKKICRDLGWEFNPCC